MGFLEKKLAVFLLAQLVSSTTQGTQGRALKTRRIFDKANEREWQFQPGVYANFVHIYIIIYI